ncbi:glycosyltransferase [Hymenobacter crusticola]|uniref:Glycosyltransferase 2-like domain-containing protein n=1 Tax=Hymenobacter crusticola TaxID=1770526 RepID=A0A243WE64_9BACT|nr:glycosyltransferase family 2 protein [Hymenobacter crusticola]OUJ73157.1 hypothetical protein BXP70_15120 [Hymenobacter crusticola]
MLQVVSNGFSIVLCTYNGYNRLKPTLEHLAALQLPVGHNVELLLIDNGSTDQTEVFAKQVWGQLGAPYPLIVLPESRAGKGYAVETGYDAASYSYILTVDDDNWLDSQYLVQAIDLFSAHPDVGILQGMSEGVFEVAPPTWVKENELYFIIGSPVEKAGYYPKNNFDVWGAGMVFKRQDWVYLRQNGFAFLTSKLAGKAAGEDTELALALIILGRKAYYSPGLKYRHFMPVERITWNKLKSNFEVLGYVSYFMALYKVAVKANREHKIVRKYTAQKQVLSAILKYGSYMTTKQHLAYWLKPREEHYQLMLAKFYSQLKWYYQLSNHIMRDVSHIQKWMVPLLDENKDFDWPW